MLMKSTLPTNPTEMALPLWPLSATRLTTIRRWQQSEEQGVGTRIRDKLKDTIKVKVEARITIVVKEEGAEEIEAKEIEEEEEPTSQMGQAVELVPAPTKGLDILTCLHWTHANPIGPLAVLRLSVEDHYPAPGRQ